jgi:hypothetical protein
MGGRTSARVSTLRARIRPGDEVCGPMSTVLQYARSNVNEHPLGHRIVGRSRVVSWFRTGFFTGNHCEVFESTNSPLINNLVFGVYTDTHEEQRRERNDA